MSGQTLLIVLACGAFSLAMTGLIFACCWTSAQVNAPARNRRKVRLALGKLLQCSHPEWN